MPAHMPGLLSGTRLGYAQRAGGVSHSRIDINDLVNGEQVHGPAGRRTVGHDSVGHRSAAFVVGVHQDADADRAEEVNASQVDDQCSGSAFEDSTDMFLELR